jgi:hypothetical protein
MFNVNADFFRAASLFQSTEETRYYLRGVLIQPHAVKGALLVATDGYRMICIHDETGTCDKPVIVKLDKAALKATKQDRRETAPRRIAGDDTNAPAWVIAGVDAEQLHMVKAWWIDGTFPDWRRVMPRIEGNAPQVCDSYNTGYMGALADAYRELTGEKEAVISIRSSHIGGPALVRWRNVENAFAVIMPVLNGTATGMPAFFDAQPKLAAEMNKAVSL